LTNERNTNFRYMIIVLALPVIGLVWLSYSNAREVAETLVGSSKEYYQLNSTKLWTNFITDEKTLLWIFVFSYPPIIDDEFQVYVSLRGEVVSTNPTDLKRRLRALERRRINGVRLKFPPKIRHGF